MMTIAICTIKGHEKLSSIKPGMAVFPYGKFVEENNRDVADSRFTDTMQGIVKDNLTGLMWFKDANHTRKSISWEEAMSFVEKLEAAGYNDWRLPTKEEFDAFLKAEPDKIKKSFDNIKYFYWTSTVYALESGFIWVADTDNRKTNYSFRTNDNYVWPVRDGKGGTKKTVRIKGGNDNDPVKAAAEKICEKYKSKYISYRVTLDTITRCRYEVRCMKKNRESTYNLEYEKLLGNWSE